MSNGYELAKLEQNAAISWAVQMHCCICNAFVILSSVKVFFVWLAVFALKLGAGEHDWLIVGWWSSFLHVSMYVPENFIQYEYKFLVNLGNSNSTSSSLSLTRTWHVIFIYITRKFNFSIRLCDWRKKWSRGRITYWSILVYLMLSVCMFGLFSYSSGFCCWWRLLLMPIRDVVDEHT